MPRRNTGVLTRVMSQLSDSVTEIEAQREPHAVFWDEWNQRAVNEDGPLWIALGDSSSQGIGAKDPLDGWIPQVLERMSSTTGDPWRVVNLAVTGAQFSDIVAHQLPRIRELASAGQTPKLMTFLAGANNLMAPNTWLGARGDLQNILDALAPRSVVARVGVHHAANTIMARRLNKVIEAAASEKDFELFWPWKWPSLDGMGADKWHPGEKGYGYMTDIIFERIIASLS